MAKTREFNGNVFTDNGKGLYNAKLKKYLIYRPYPLLVDEVMEGDKVEPDNKQEYTSKQLKDKFGTDDTSLINAGKEKEEQVAKVEEDEETTKSTIQKKIDRKIEEIKANTPNIDAEKLAVKLENYVYDEVGVFDQAIEDYINEASGFKDYLEENYHPQNLINEIKNYKGKRDYEYQSAKDIFLARWKHYLDEDPDKASNTLKNTRILEESEDYLLYADKDNEGVIWMNLTSSYDPKSRFQEMPNVYYQENYKGGINAGSARVNWASYGSVYTEDAREFASKLQRAVDFAERLNQGKDYQDLWEDE